MLSAIAIELQPSSPAPTHIQNATPSINTSPAPDSDVLELSEAAGLAAFEQTQRVFEVAPSNVEPRSRNLVTVLIIASNLVQMISNMAGFAGSIYISKLLGVDGEANWVAASYPLTQGTFVLMSGRLGAIYGHKNMLLAGGALFILCTFICGFCRNFVAFSAMRAVSGIGGAFIMPNAVAMLNITNPPGRVRNLSLGFFSASAPIGGYFGALLAGLIIKYTHWSWIFFAISILAVLIFAPLWYLLPPEVPVDRNGKVDWIGAAFGTTALILFNFTWNQAPAVGWSQPYEIALIICSSILFTSFIIWEHSFTDHPIMPLKVFRAKSLSPLLIVVLLNYMSNGTLLWYMVVWLQETRGWSVLNFALGWTPFLIFGTLAAVLAAWLIPRISAQWILAIGTVTIIVSNLLLATMPAQQSYWAQVFPATILMAFCPDLVYTAAQIIASNAVRRDEQGVAGSLIGTLNLYGNSLGLGFASTIESEVGGSGIDKIIGYKAALYFGASIGIVALVLDICFVRLVKDERDGWGNEDREEAVATALNTREPIRTEGQTSTLTQRIGTTQEV